VYISFPKRFLYQSNNLPSINLKDIVNIFIFTSSWTTLSFERASIITTWDPSCQQLGLLPHTYSQALLVLITIDPMKIANFFCRDPILIIHLSLSTFIIIHKLVYLSLPAITWSSCDCDSLHVKSIQSH
jgi:hypothetical protein